MNNSYWKELAQHCWNQKFGRLDFDQEKFCEMILVDCLMSLQHLRGYSGVGSDGNPYDTPSWNAALEAAAAEIKTRFGVKTS